MHKFPILLNLLKKVSRNSSVNREPVVGVTCNAKQEVIVIEFSLL